MSDHDHERRADQHRPIDAEGVRLAVQELYRQGLKVRDIAAALRLEGSAVHALLEEPSKLAA